MSGDYDGWPFHGGASITCLDCDDVSPEYEYLHDLLSWIDRHILTCVGWEGE